MGIQHVFDSPCKDKENGKRELARFDTALRSTANSNKKSPMAILDNELEGLQWKRT